MAIVSDKILYVLAYLDEKEEGRLEATSNKEIIAKRSIEILGSLTQKSKDDLRLFMEEDIFPPADSAYSRLDLSTSQSRAFKNLYIYIARIINE